MTALWTSAQIAAATNGREGPPFAATGISIDSRTLQQGDVFIALVGPNFDGHDYLDAALRAGAAGALATRGEGPVVQVADTMTALEDLGRAARDRAQAKIVAVTGSVGKTSSKEMLKLALEAQGPTHASAGSLNNHWGVPLSLSRMAPDSRFGIFELGMNHAGEIAPLSRMVRPHVAIITTVEAVHLENFANVEGIADAKAEIFAGLETGGAAILNRDNPHFGRLAKAAMALDLRIISFGAHEAADNRLMSVELDDATRVTAMIGQKEIRYSVGVPGRQWAMNSLAILSAVPLLGGNVEIAAKALAGMIAPKGRGERHFLAANLVLIDESYNASPVSMRAALAALAATAPKAQGRRIAVMGDMLELGSDSPSLHAGLAEPIAENGIDLVFTAGEMMARLHDALPAASRGAHAEDSQALAPLVAAALKPGDVVMVKGSAGSRMGRVVDAIVKWSAAETVGRGPA